MSSFESKQTRPFVGGWLHDSHSWMNIISYYSAINLFCWLTSITELRRNKCSIRTENKQVLPHFMFIVISLYADSVVLFRVPIWKFISIESVSLFFCDINVLYSKSILSIRGCCFYCMSQASFLTKFQNAF